MHRIINIFKDTFNSLINYIFYWKMKLLHYRDIHIRIRYSIIQLFSIFILLFMLIHKLF